MGRLNPFLMLMGKLEAVLLFLSRKKPYIPICNQFLFPLFAMVPKQN